MCRTLLLASCIGWCSGCSCCLFMLCFGPMFSIDPCEGVLKQCKWTWCRCSCHVVVPNGVLQQLGIPLQFNVCAFVVVMAESETFNLPIVCLWGGAYSILLSGNTSLFRYTFSAPTDVLSERVRPLALLQPVNAHSRKRSRAHECGCFFLGPGSRWWRGRGLLGRPSRWWLSEAPPASQVLWPLLQAPAAATTQWHWRQSERPRRGSEGAAEGTFRPNLFLSPFFCHLWVCSWSSTCAINFSPGGSIQDLSRDHAILKSKLCL